MRAYGLGVGVVLFSLGGALSAQTSPDAASEPCSTGLAQVEGVVRRIGGAPIGGRVEVSIGWNVILMKGITVRTARCERRIIAGADGAFRVAGLPADQPLLLKATGPAGEVGVALRHDALSQPLAVFLPATADIDAAPRALGFSGSACRTRGRVVNRDGEAVASARVQVADHATVTTDARGAFDVPVCDSNGTSFDVRSLAVARGTWWVDTPSVPPAWALSLDRALPTLEQVVVRAPQREFRDVTGFERRRRIGAGRFITRADILRRKPVRVQDLVAELPGVLISPDGELVTYGRRGGPMGCPLSVVWDGIPAPGFDLNAISPDEVQGIEVYSGFMPLEYNFLVPQPFWFGGASSSCGALLIWTQQGIGRAIGS